MRKGESKMELELLARFERQFDERYTRPTPASMKRAAKLRMDYEMYGEVDPELVKEYDRD